MDKPKPRITTIKRENGETIVSLNDTHFIGLSDDGKRLGVWKVGDQEQDESPAAVSANGPAIDFYIMLNAIFHIPDEEMSKIEVAIQHMKKA